MLHIPALVPAEHCSMLIDRFKQLESDAYREVSAHPNGSVLYSTFDCVTLSPTLLEFWIAKRYIQKARELWHRYLLDLGYFHDTHIRFTYCRFLHRMRILRYGPGQKIHQHSDYDLGVHGSCTLNLSDGYQGGDFVFFRGQQRLKLGLGDALIFPADVFWVHEVEPVISGTRYSINTFLMEHPLDPTKMAKNQLDVIAKQPIFNAEYLGHPPGIDWQ